MPTWKPSRKNCSACSSLPEKLCTTPRRSADAPDAPRRRRRMRDAHAGSPAGRSRARARAGRRDSASAHRDRVLRRRNRARIRRRRPAARARSSLEAHRDAPARARRDTSDAGRTRETGRLRHGKDRAACRSPTARSPARSAASRHARVRAPARCAAIGVELGRVDMAVAVDQRDHAPIVAKHAARKRMRAGKCAASKSCGPASRPAISHRLEERAPDA